jgi:hypothetical protein
MAPREIIPWPKSNKVPLIASKLGLTPGAWPDIYWAMPQGVPKVRGYRLYLYGASRGFDCGLLKFQGAPEVELG